MTRSCPGCGADSPQTLADIEAALVVSGNATYRQDALRVLDLPANAKYALARCTECSFVYGLDLPDAGFLARLYGEVIDPMKALPVSKSAGWIGHQLHLAADLLMRVEKSNGVRLLDYGCGSGAVVKALTAADIACIGFDPYYARSSNVQQITDSLASVRAAAPFDAILLSDVLEHVAAPTEVLAECHSLLGPDGWLCVSVPDFGPVRLRRVLAELASGKLVTPELNPWEHLNYFSQASLASMVERARFRLYPEPARFFGFRNENSGLRKITNTVRSLGRLIRFAVSPAPGTTTIFARKM